MAGRLLTVPLMARRLRSPALAAAGKGTPPRGAPSTSSRADRGVGDPRPPAPIAVERITVKKDRMALLVRLSPACPRVTDDALARRLLAAVPTLARHSCVNDVGPIFGCVIASTSLPHVFEHLVIDAQVRACASFTDITFVGTTEWLDERAGLARVEVNFADDLIALRAVNDALAYLNGEVVA